MKLMTKETAKTVSGAAKGGIKDARKQASSAMKDAQKQASAAMKDAQKQARKQVVRARIAAARTRVGAPSRTDAGAKKAIGAAGAAGLAAGYFLDPDSGKRRRHIARDRALALIRKEAERPNKPAPNDQALAERVRSEIFQPADGPKESVNINVENGVVYLRGEVERPDQIRELVKQAESVDGVAGVENLLHTP
jgi:BON domain